MISWTSFFVPVKTEILNFPKSKSPPAWRTCAREFSFKVETHHFSKSSDKEFWTVQKQSKSKKNISRHDRVFRRNNDFSLHKKNYDQKARQKNWDEYVINGFLQIQTSEKT